MNGTGSEWMILPALFPGVAQAEEYINKITPRRGLKGETVYNVPQGSKSKSGAGGGVQE